MKNSRTLFVLLLLLTIFTIHSCKDDDISPHEDPVDVHFGFSPLNTSNSGGESPTESSIKYIRLKIEDENGDEMFNGKLARDNSSADQFVFETVSLEPGTYWVTEFIVLDNNENTVYIAPKENSDRALLVNQALPQTFEVTQNQIEPVNVEVLEIGDDTPDSFGYGGFQFVLVPTFKFQIVVFIFDLEASQYRLIEADLRIKVDDVLRVDRQLEKKTNLVEVNDEGVNYEVTVTSEGNIDPYVREFSLEELKSYGTQSDNGPLQITLQFHVNVQDRLNSGETPKEIFDTGVPLDSLYGKVYEGGLIFHLDTSNGSGFVAATKDQGNRKWGCSNVLINGTLGALGKGANNTEILRAKFCPNDPTLAAGATNILDGGFDDWFLPSSQELEVMYNNLKVNNLGGFTSNYYWTSSESDRHYAHAIRFSDGKKERLTKASNPPVRAVRQFSGN